MASPHFGVTVAITFTSWRRLYLKQVGLSTNPSALREVLQ
jgi:hypothetical protein